MMHDASAEKTESVRSIALAAKEASVPLATTTSDARNEALRSMACALRAHAAEIVAENSLDMQAAKNAGTSEGMLDRLMLNVDRVDAMAAALEDLCELADPLGVVQQHRELTSGLDLKRVSVPLGVVAMVYEARPNVTADAAGICIKTGNACVLRGGSLAAHSNAIIARIVHEAAVEAGMSVNCIRAIETTDRAATDELMSLHGVVDVLIPRGGAGLIRHCVEHSKVPVIETGTGNCHIYVHEAADFAVAQAIVLNAKLRRLGVCNAAEGLLVDRSIAEAFLPAMMSALADNGVCLHADEQALTIAQNAGITSACAATDEDWATEYLDLDISVTCVDG
ncbi:MAG: glutamate-5-semialdehyde dehydrogenase, partial [Raoultibacter sp.]